MIDARHIAFSPETLCAIVAKSPLLAETFGLPAGPPDGVRMVPEETRVEMVYGTGGKARGFSVPAAALGALLIGYCRRARQPLPRVSRKAVIVHPDKVVLAVLTEFREMPPLVAPETPSAVAHRIREGLAASWVDPATVWPARGRDAPPPGARAWPGPDAPDARAWPGPDGSDRPQADRSAAPDRAAGGAASVPPRPGGA